MKRILFIAVVCLFAHAGLSAQTVRTYTPARYGYEIDAAGDTVPVVRMRPVYCFRRPADLRKWNKLIRDLKIVYPIAQTAKAKMHNLEEELMKLPTRKEQRAYTRSIEREVKEEYTPVLKHMTRSQGKLLIRLIDRETEITTYQIVKEFRGGFVAGFWQGIARIFGQNLKDEYDREVRDREVEQLILLYEAGLL